MSGPLYPVRFFEDGRKDWNAPMTVSLFFIPIHQTQKPRTNQKIPLNGEGGRGIGPI